MSDRPNESSASGLDADVLSDLTREARTALGAILGYTEILLEDFSTDRPEASTDLNRIRAAAEHVMGLVARLEQQVARTRQEAGRDPLTGVANRRILESSAAALFEDQQPLSVLLLDLDRFKEINDTHGHLVGDEVLKAVVERCRRAVRDSDLITRFAGDEFVVVLPGTGEAEAHHVAARVARHIGGDPVRTKRATVTVTASVGIATRNADDRGLADLLDRADRAMYLDKSSKRRNRS